MSYDKKITNNKTPHTIRYTAFCLSVKNEGYKYEPLRRLVLRRVEQCTGRLRVRLLSTVLLNTINMTAV